MFGTERIYRAGDAETKVRRTFTTYDRTSCRICQYIKWVLVFRVWAQKAVAILILRLACANLTNSVSLESLWTV